MRSVSQGSLKSRKSEYGALILRSDQAMGTASALGTTMRTEMESLVAKYNLLHEVGQTAKRDMANCKTEVSDLRAEVSSYKTVTDVNLEGLKSDLWNEVSADHTALLQEIAEEESFRLMLIEEVRELNLEIRHTQRMIRDCQSRISGLEGFTGAGRPKGK